MDTAEHHINDSLGTKFHSPLSTTGAFTSTEHTVTTLDATTANITTANCDYLSLPGVAPLTYYLHTFTEDASFLDWTYGGPITVNGRAMRINSMIILYFEGLSIASGAATIACAGTTLPAHYHPTSTQFSGCAATDNALAVTCHAVLNTNGTLDFRGPGAAGIFGGVGNTIIQEQTFVFHMD